MERPANLGSSAKLLRLLRLIGLNEAAGGLRLTDLVVQTGFDKSTVHRALGCLVEEGFVGRSEDSKRYRLGIEATQLALAVADHSAIRDMLRPVLMRVARKSGDVAYLMMRIGPNVVCLQREVGPLSIKSLLAEEGVVRPLGLSTVGVSILATLGDAEVSAAYDANAWDYKLRGLERDQLFRLVRETRTTRYAEVPFLSNEVFGVGLGIQVSPRVQAGIGVIGINSRMDAGRRAQLGQLLLEELLPLSTRAWPGLSAPT
ncbi:IclR family transcriptional regulator [Burkholderiales bacterium 8X]|nr:IclR family transcriptional regulator [Burkholderiales bacterium 8X]